MSVISLTTIEFAAKKLAVEICYKLTPYFTLAITHTHTHTDATNQQFYFGQDNRLNLTSNCMTVFFP